MLYLSRNEGEPNLLHRPERKTSIMIINSVSVMRSYEYKELLSYYLLSGHFVMPSYGNCERNTDCDDLKL